MEADPHPQHAPSLYCRYEDEINRRTAAENEFVVLKKVRARCLGQVRGGSSENV